MESYTKNGKTILYEVIKKKNKNTYFRIHEDHLRVTTNRYATKGQITRFIDLKFDQFYEKIYHSKRVEKSNQLTLWGIPYTIVLSAGKFTYSITDEQIFIQTKLTDLRKIKEQVYQAELIKKIKTLEPMIFETVSKQGLPLLPIKLKYLKSKFGSYHRKNNEITLNTFLARLDPIFLIYVIYHEYAHALVFNHSKEFYNLLGEFMPNHKLYQKDLKKIAII
jgi:predicted metal-dependent hydrolase